MPGRLTTEGTGRIRLPVATAKGPGDVSTGFPRTPEGALAQLVELDQTVLSGMSLPHAQLVAEQWIATGGPAADEWSVVRAVGEILTGSGQPAQGTALQVVVEPVMGAFRVGDGLSDRANARDTVTPCVDFVIALPEFASEQIAAADCQRMTWVGGRWVIAPGAEEPAPESLWPGSSASVEAGWQWLVGSR